MLAVVRSPKRALATLVAVGALATGFGVPAASAQQNGLVNVDISNLLNNNTVVANVTIPVNAAANICGVNVAVLAQLASTGGTCTSTANPNLTLSNITNA